MLLFQLLFWISFILLFHSYLLYPFIMNLWGNKKRLEKKFYNSNELPKVAIVIAAYNEEKVIEEKIESTLRTDYPNHLFQIFIGSDCSSDNTNSIIDAFCEKTDKITFANFKERGGKQEVLNKLFKSYIKPQDFDICIMTDANIIF